MEIFYDILSAIQTESQASEIIRPTRIQQICNISYDKFSKYLNALNNEGLIKNPPITITEKGEKLLRDYEKIRDFLTKMKLEYLTKEGEIQNVRRG